MEFFESGITFCTFDTVVATKALLLTLLSEFERNEFVIRYFLLSSHLKSPVITCGELRQCWTTLL